MFQFLKKLISKVHYLGFILSIVIAWQTFNTSKQSAEELRDTFKTQSLINEYKTLSINLQRSLFISSSALVLRQPEVFTQAINDYRKSVYAFSSRPFVYDEKILESLDDLTNQLENIEVSFRQGAIPSKGAIKRIINTSENIRVSLSELENKMAQTNGESQIQWMNLQGKESWLQKTSRMLVSLLLMFLTWTSIQREKAEKIVRASESLYKLLFASLAEGVILCLRDGTITFANESLSKFLKIKPGKLVGRKLTDFYPVLMKKDRTFYEFGSTPIDLACKSQGTVENMTMGIEHENQKVKWYSVNSQPVFDPSINESVSAVISFTDITKAIEDEEVIASQQDQIVQTSKMAALGEMAGGVAHEINNPLAIIQMKSDELEELAEDEGQVEGEEAKALASQINKTVNRISKIVRGLKTFAREGSADPFENVKLNELIEDILEFSKPRIEQADIKFELQEVPENILLSCRATQIEQVLVNLLNNARDAVEPLPEKWIKLGFDTEDEKIRIHVTDSGHGIPKEVAEKLFQPFFTTKAVGKGTGLGMSISKGIIDAHNGQLFIDHSNANTRFVIELPISQGEEANIPEVA